MSIDIETYSDIDIKYGVHKYVSSPNFEVLLFGYAFDDEEVTVIDLTEQELPQAIIAALYDKEIRKTAFNAAFEITCLRRLSYLHDMDDYHRNAYFQYLSNASSQLLPYGRHRYHHNALYD